MKKNALTAILITLLLSSALITIAAGVENPRGRRHEKPSKPAGTMMGNRILLNSTLITAEFEGQKPKVKFYYTDDRGNVTRFYVNYKRLIEYEDKNYDGAFQKNESVAKFELESAKWNHTNFYNILNRSTVVGIGINFTVETPIHIAGKEGKTYNVTVMVVARMYQNQTTERISRNGKWVNYTLGVGEIKTDFIVGNWPFSQSKNSLAFEVELIENIPKETRGPHHFEIVEDKTRARIKSNTNETALGRAEHRATPPKNETKINFVGDALNRTHAFFRFVNTAFLTNKAGVSLVAVNSSYITDGHALRFYVSYPYFNGTIEHDPSFGVVSENYPIPQLSIKSLIVDKATLTEGDTFTVTCVVDNVGESNASSVVAIMNAPGFETQQPNKSMGTIAAGSSGTVSFSLKTLKAGSYSLNVSVSSPDADIVSKLVSVGVQVNYTPYAVGGVIVVGVGIGALFYFRRVRGPKPPKTT